MQRTLRGWMQAVFAAHGAGGIKKLVGLLQRVFFSAQDKTRTCTNVIVHYPLKVACLPISPPGRHCRISHFGCANIEFIFESAKFSGALCRKNDFFLPAARLRGSRKAGGRPPQGGLGRLWRPPGGWLRGGLPPGRAAGVLLRQGPVGKPPCDGSPALERRCCGRDGWAGPVGRSCRAVLLGVAAGLPPDRRCPIIKKEPSAPMRGERLPMALRAGLPQRTKSISRKR